ncbi:hypothetical protein [Parasphingorhabdus sp.]|uniref:hypothetical protein n=1 Tax=Parasphingorhabdus sp. TaxID=2709688 RepID=UPI003D275C6A
MPRNVRYSLLLLLLVLLTVPLKLFYAPPPPNPDEQRLADDIAAMLQAKGFALSFGEMVEVPTIAARKPSCNLLVTHVGGAGYANARFGIAAADFGATEYHYHGQLMQDFPRFWPVIEERLNRWLRPLGLSSQIHPVLAIAGQAKCSDEALDWSAFRLHEKS